MHIEDKNYNRFTWETAARTLRCSKCKHRNKKTCKAFPDGIPSEVFDAVDNDINYQCSKDYKFEPKDN